MTTPRNKHLPVLFRLFSIIPFSKKSKLSLFHTPGQGDCQYFFSGFSG
jgi:hypothetical protein